MVSDVCLLKNSVLYKAVLLSSFIILNFKFLMSEEPLRIKNGDQLYKVCVTSMVSLVPPQFAGFHLILCVLVEVLYVTS